MMRLFIPGLVMFLTLFQICKGQASSQPREFFNKEFNWRIEIPEGFKSVPPREWKKMESHGTELIEKTYDIEVENNARTLFVFQSDAFNYFESNYQPFDTAKDGNYLESFRNVNKVLFGTFQAQMPNVQIDSVSSQEMIDGKLFETFKVIIIIPEKLRLEYIMFSRLFGNKEFTVNIMTINKEKHAILLNAWRNSKFGTP